MDQRFIPFYVFVATSCVATVAIVSLLLPTNEICPLMKDRNNASANVCHYKLDREQIVQLCEYLRPDEKAAGFQCFTSRAHVFFAPNSSTTTIIPLIYRLPCEWIGRDDTREEDIDSKIKERYLKGTLQFVAHVSWHYVGCCDAVLLFLALGQRAPTTRHVSKA